MITTAEKYNASVESGVTTSCYDLLTPCFADYPQMGWFNSDTVKRCRIQEKNNFIIPEIGQEMSNEKTT